MVSRVSFFKRTENAFITVHSTAKNLPNGGLPEAETHYGNGRRISIFDAPVPVMVTYGIDTQEILMSKKLERRQYILERYRKRKKIQIAIMLAMVAIIIILVVLSTNPEITIGDLSQDNIVLIALFIVIAGFVGAFANWRCPVCNKYLGRGIWQKQCNNCGTKFTDDPEHP